LQLGGAHFDGAELVADRNIGRAQQGDFQAGDVKGVAAFFVESCGGLFVLFDEGG
jgi:hypothetical protein